VASEFQLGPVDAAAAQPWPERAAGAGQVGTATAAGPIGAVRLGRPVPGLKRTEFRAAHALGRLLEARLTGAAAGFRTGESGSWFQLDLPAAPGHGQQVLDEAREVLRSVWKGQWSDGWWRGVLDWPDQIRRAAREPEPAAAWIAHAWKHGLHSDFLAEQSQVDEEELKAEVRELARVLDPDQLAAAVVDGTGTPGTPATEPGLAGDHVFG